MTRSTALVLVTVLSTGLSTACRGSAESPKTEAPSLNVTNWTEATELYMEHPPLVAGQRALFAVDLTTLADFKALNAGTPSIEFTPENGGTPVVLRGSPPSRPGAFRVEGTPPAAGRYRWALLIDAPGLRDRHDLGNITVFPDEASGRAAAEKQPAGDPSAVAYLKEQQWTNEFATAAVGDSELRTSLRVPAAVEPLSGGDAVVAAPAAGRFTAASLVAIGTTVRAGQVLGRLEPRLSGSDDRATLAADMAQAQVALDGARAEQSRAEGLLAERAVPARRVEDARRAVAVAETQLHAAQARLAQRDQTLHSGGGAASGNAFAVRAPIAGRVSDVYATLGASFDEGSPLFRIVRTDRVGLRAQVPASDVAAVRGTTDVALEIPGRPDLLPLRSERQHDAGVIDAQTGALPVTFDVENPGGQLLVGQSGTAVLYKRDRVRVPTVPKAAVLLEAGRPYVWIQTGGEQFARRYIEIAARDGDSVGCRSGVKPGDRVVIRGAYEVQLASAARGLPAEGHVH